MKPPAPAGTPHVLMLTSCWDRELLFGATTTFKTLRVGFPTARVTVYENASIKEARNAIRAEAQRTGCEFIQLHQDLTQDAWLRRVLTEFPLTGQLVILDPDLAFWRSVEQWDFGGALLAGRHVPAWDAAGELIVERLHPSFWWIPDVARLRRRIERIEDQGRLGNFAYLRLLEACTVLPAAGGGFRDVFLDVGANLFAAIRTEARSFGPAELECYDHLNAASYFIEALKKSPGALPELREIWRNFAAGNPDAPRELLDLYRVVKRGEVEAMRGIWRFQDLFFAAREPKLPGAQLGEVCEGAVRVAGNER